MGIQTLPSLKGWCRMCPECLFLLRGNKMQKLIDEIRKKVMEAVYKNRLDNVKIGLIGIGDTIDHTLYEVTILLDEIDNNIEDLNAT